MAMLRGCQADGNEWSVDELESLEGLHRGRYTWLACVGQPDEISEKISELLDLPDDLDLHIGAPTKRIYLKNHRQTLFVRSFVVTDGERGYEVSPWCFVLSDDLLLTWQDGGDEQVQEAFLRLQAVEPTPGLDAQRALIFCLESRLGLAWDQIEEDQQAVYVISDVMVNSDPDSTKMLAEMVRLFDRLMFLRESITEMQRLIYTIMKASFLRSELAPRISIISEQCLSLLSHMDYLNQALRYQQDTLRGLQNENQARILKIFTILSLVLMPPTVVAGIYGMNFEAMPELKFPYGYPAALGLMVVSAIMPLLWFRMRQWL